MSSKTKPDGVLARSLQICVVYAVTSIVISMSYKALLSVYKFDAKFAMLSYQLAIALALCAVLKVGSHAVAWGIWALLGSAPSLQRWFGGVPGLEVPDFSWEVLYKSIPPGVVFTLNMVIGLSSLRPLCERGMRASTYCGRLLQVGTASNSSTCPSFSASEGRQPRSRSSPSGCCSAASRRSPFNRVSKGVFCACLIRRAWRFARTCTVALHVGPYILRAMLCNVVAPAGVVVIVVGAVIAGWESMHSDPLGLAYTFANNLCTATSYNLVRRAGGGSWSPPLHLQHCGSLHLAALADQAVQRLDACVGLRHPYVQRSCRTAALPRRSDPAQRVGLHRALSPRRQRCKLCESPALTAHRPL